MPRHREVRDPIHGFVRIDDRECDIVDSRLLQRLRRVRQLAMAYLVYPGATHTRFDHTLGVVHVAGRMCRTLNVDAAHTRLIRFAALLHDVGHGPFSHVSEEVLVQLASPELKSAASGTSKIHELITRRIIRSDPEIGEIISLRDREEIIQLLDRGLDQPIYRDILSGPLDADKQDYLLRDSYYCGVRYGVYDIERLHAVLGRERDITGDTLVIDEDGLHTLEQFVLARYFLTTQVIRHKGRLISDQMLVRALTLGVRADKIDFLKRLYEFNETNEFVEEYLAWNDERLLSALLEPEFQHSWAGGIVRRLVERRLYKRLFQRPVADISPLAGVSGSQLSDIKPILESEIAEMLSSQSDHAVDEKEVILHLTKDPPPKKSEGSVLLRGTGSTLRTFEEESMLFGSINQTLRTEFIECYAPIAIADESKRRQTEARVAELITTRIQDLLSPQGQLFAGHSEEISHGD